MCVAKFAVNPSWLEDSAEAGRLLRESLVFILLPTQSFLAAEESYWISDEEKENRFKFSLKEVFAMNRSTPVLQDITIYATEHIGMDVETLKHVVISAGGQVSLFHHL